MQADKVYCKILIAGTLKPVEHCLPPSPPNMFTYHCPFLPSWLSERGCIPSTVPTGSRSECVVCCKCEEGYTYFFSPPPPNYVCKRVSKRGGHCCVRLY